jgi:hypothetical protein
MTLKEIAIGMIGATGVAAWIWIMIDLLAKILGLAWMLS